MCNHCSSFSKKENIEVFAETQLGPCQTPTMEPFVKIVNPKKPLTVSQKSLFIDVSQDPRYASGLGLYTYLPQWTLQNLTL